MVKCYEPFTYGNQDMVRPELVQDIIRQRKLVAKVALTSHHPAFKDLVAIEAQATTTELEKANEQSSPFVCTIY